MPDDGSFLGGVSVVVWLALSSEFSEVCGGDVGFWFDCELFNIAASVVGAVSATMFCVLLSSESEDESVADTTKPVLDKTI